MISATSNELNFNNFEYPAPEGKQQQITSFLNMFGTTATTADLVSGDHQVVTSESFPAGAFDQKQGFYDGNNTSDMVGAVSYFGDNMVEASHIQFYQQHQQHHHHLNNRASPALSADLTDTDSIISRFGSPLVLANSGADPDMLSSVSASASASYTNSSSNIGSGSTRKPHLEGLASLKRENKSEYRRQVHVRSEQQRREKIKGSIQALQAQLPDFVLSTVKSLRLSKTATIRLAIKAIEGWSKRIQDLEAEISSHRELLKNNNNRI